MQYKMLEGGDFPLYDTGLQENLILWDEYQKGWLGEAT